MPKPHLLSLLNGILFLNRAETRFREIRPFVVNDVTKNWNVNCSFAEFNLTNS